MKHSPLFLTKSSYLFFFVIVICISACGGGGGGGNSGGGGGTPPDTTPDAFSFIDQTDVPLNGVVTSNVITINGINAAANLSITNGEYSIDGGSFASTNTTIANGQTFTVRHTASGSYLTTVDTLITIGGVSDTFSSTTVTAPPDTTPDVFSFSDQVDVALSSIVTSNSITVNGINAAANISVTGGEYAIDGGAFTSSSGTIANGQAVVVRHTSAASNNTTTNTELTIGGVSAVFSSTTEAAVIGTVQPSLSYGIKQFIFSWNDGSYSHYRLLENPDGVTGYTQISGDIAPGTENYVHDVALFKRSNASYILQSCNGAVCEDSNPVLVSSSLVEAIGYFKNQVPQGSDDVPNNFSVDGLGFKVALSGDGNTLVVSSRMEASSSTGVDGVETDTSVPQAGAVYVFRKSAGVWQQDGYLKASNTGEGDQFGFSIAVSDDGNTIAVGAPYEDSSDFGVNATQGDLFATSDIGAVYIFARDSGGWTQQEYIKSWETVTVVVNQGLEFGYSVALSADGNLLAVGAPGEIHPGRGVGGVFPGPITSLSTQSDSGAVFTFNRSGSTWAQGTFIKSTVPVSTPIFQHRFGAAVAISGDGNTLAIGAPEENSLSTGINGEQNIQGASDSGAVFIYNRVAGLWSSTASNLTYLKASNTQSQDDFGRSLALSDDGNTLAVGAILEDSNATLIDGDDSNNDATTSGAAYLFYRDAGVWNQQAYVKAINTDGGDNFGYSLSLSGDGNTLAVVGYRDSAFSLGVDADPFAASGNGSPGAVHLYQREGSIWSYLNYVKAKHMEILDIYRFGDSVSLSDDGESMAVGSSAEIYDAVGINGTPSNPSAQNSGAAFLY